MKLIKKNNRGLFIGFIILILLVGFIFRVAGLWQNSSFWIDEASSAGFARAILERWVPVLSTGYFVDNYLLHLYLMAGSMKIFGLNEFAARFPSVVFGTLAILMAYFLAKKITNKEVGLLTGLFMTFSVWEITMSRQARSYQTLQFFYLTSIFFFYWLIEKIDQKSFRLKNLGLCLILIVFSALTHMIGLIVWVGFLVYLVSVRFDIIKKLYEEISLRFPTKFSKVFILIVFFGISFFVLEYLNFFRGIKQAIWNTAENQFTLFNHFKYYHSLLWRQYGLFTFLGFLGLIWFSFKKPKESFLIWFILIIHSAVVFFRFPEAYTRYLFVIYPIILIFFSYALWQIWEWFFDSLKKNNHFWFMIKKTSLILLGLFIVLNGYKFTIKPKLFYSANPDMIELPEPDYKAAYQFILNKDPQREFVLIDNRIDAAIWYLGEGYPDYYLGGQEKNVLWRLAGGDDFDDVSGARYLTTKESLENVVRQNKKGFVVLEMPTVEYAKLDMGIIDYVRKNLIKEIKIDKIGQNQTGDWPIEIYSWGY